MTLSDKQQEAFRIVSELSESTRSSSDLLPLMDYTLLNLTASRQDIEQAARLASEHQVAALCIYPEHLSYRPEPVTINTAIVINFPTGNAPLNEALNAIDLAKQHPMLHEIDYVFPYEAYWAGDEKKALSHCRAVYHHCQQNHLLLKVILETGAMNDIHLIYKLSNDILHTGCDFLKTSTGKIETGATLSAAFAILSAINDTNSSCGIKLSGGIRSLSQASSYTHLAEHLLGKKVNPHWFRIGASRLGLS